MMPFLSFPALLGHCERVLLIFIAHFSILIRTLSITNIFHGYYTWFKNIILIFCRFLGITPLLFTSGIIKRTSAAAFFLRFFFTPTLALLVSFDINAKLLRISDDFPVMHDKYDELIEISLRSDFSNVNGVPRSSGTCAIVRRSSR